MVIDSLRVMSLVSTRLKVSVAVRASERVRTVDFNTVSVAVRPSERVREMLLMIESVIVIASVKTFATTLTPLKTSVLVMASLRVRAVDLITVAVTVTLSVSTEVKDIVPRTRCVSMYAFAGCERPSLDILVGGCAVDGLSNKPGWDYRRRNHERCNGNDAVVRPNRVYICDSNK